MRRALVLLLAPWLLVACDDGDPQAAGGAAGPDRIEFADFKGDGLNDTPKLVDSALGRAGDKGLALELVVTDVWGRLPDAPGTVSLVRGDGASVTLEGYLRPVVLRLSQPGQYTLKADLPGHHAEAFTFEVSRDLHFVRPAERIRHWALSRSDRSFGGDPQAVYSLYLGLEHTLFAASGPAPRKGTRLELFDNGADAWASVALDLSEAVDHTHMSFWLVKEDFELTRSDDYRAVTEDERWDNTLLGWLDSLPGTRRLLLNQFWGESDFINDVAVLDDGLQARAEARGDDIEIVMQPNLTEVPYYDTLELRDDEWSFIDRLVEANPDFAERDFADTEDVKPSVYDREVRWSDLQSASWHQKFLTVDGVVGYLGGMNMNYADWDRSALEIFDPLRAPIDATAAERDAIAAGKADSATGPRRDYMVRVEGRIVDDLEALFQKRWDLALSKRQAYAENGTPFSRTVPPDLRGDVPGSEVQLTVTTPMPFWEHSILEGMRRMIENAEQFIYIEDQYFRAPLLNEIIERRMREVPGLRLVVVTKPVGYWDPGRRWTAEAHKRFYTRFPSRYALYQLRAHDIREDDGEMVARFADVDVHSKMLIVDDAVMNVGSANKNNRGLI
ncbi:MAG: hypothetical protein KC613_14980, partial [Myxococcales bacterium]|nr:hypothetical protein [Myxococcales bacterium]